jgi:hypothetical protein
MVPKQLHGRDASDTNERAAVERAERAGALISALCTVLETTGRIMVGSATLGVRVRQTTSSVPGWTDGDSIFLNEQLIHELFGAGRDPAEAVRIVKGTNYHELAHVMFTPRQGTPFNTQLMEWARYDYTKLLLANAIEDQRIETLYTREFSATSHYFVASAMQWLLRDLNAFEVALAYPLLRGRRYLPTGFREQARAAFTTYFTERIAGEMDVLVDTYIATSPVGDPEGSLTCIKGLHRLLLQAAARGTSGARLHAILDSSTTCRVSLEKGSIDALAEARALAGLKQEIDAELPWVVLEPLPPSDSSGGRIAIAGSDEAIEFKSDDLLEAARRAFADSLRNAQLALDVNRTCSALQAEMDRLQRGGDAPGPAGGWVRRVPPRLINCSNRLAERLRLFHDELEPALVHDLPAGKLNITRAIRLVAQSGRFDVFDRYEPGNEEEAEMEVVILLDLSSSMKPQIDEAAAAMWVVKRALDRTGARTSVYGFGAQVYVLYDPSARVRAAEMHAFPADDCDTRPYEALRLAYRTIRTSSRPNTMLVIITDGRWGGPGHDASGPSDHLIAAMRAAGAKTLLFTLGGRLHHGGHNCEHVYEITSPEQVVDVIEEAVAGTLASAIA